MLDIKFVRENKEIVKENIKKKFQDEKLPLVDEVIDLDVKIRALKQQGDTLRQSRNDISSEIGTLMRDKKIDEANKKKDEVKKRLINGVIGIVIALILLIIAKIFMNNSEVIAKWILEAGQVK